MMSKDAQLIFLNATYLKELASTFQMWGTSCDLTDYAKLTGSSLGLYHTSIVDGNKSYCLNKEGGLSSIDIKDRNVSIRPILVLPLEQRKNLVAKAKKYNIFEVSVGSYPQNAVRKDYVPLLNKALRREKLEKTPFSYTIDDVYYMDGKEPFTPVSYPSYFYANSSYVRIKTNLGEQNTVVLSNKDSYRNKEDAWFEVSPLNWYINKETGVLISKKMIISGISSKLLSYYANHYLLDEMLVDAKPKIKHL